MHRPGRPPTPAPRPVVGADAVFPRRVRTYGEAPADEVVLLEGSSGLLELAVNGGSAATVTGLGRGDVVEVSSCTRGVDVV